MKEITDADYERIWNEANRRVKLAKHINKDIHWVSVYNRLVAKVRREKEAK